MSTPTAYILPVLPTTFPLANLPRNRRSLVFVQPRARQSARIMGILEPRKGRRRCSGGTVRGGDERREAFRKAVATGVKKTKESLVTTGTMETQIGVVVKCPDEAHDASE